MIWFVFQVENWSQCDKEWGRRLQAALDEYKAAAVSFKYPSLVTLYTF